MSANWRKVRQLTLKGELLKQLKQDEDPMQSIDHRLDELRAMAKPRREPGTVLDRMPADTREKVLKVHRIPMAKFKRDRRKGWRLINKFRQAAKTALLLVKAFYWRKLYLMDESDSSPFNKNIPTTATQSVGLRSSIGLDMQLSLTTLAEYRNTKQLKTVMWLLRATKAFKQLFPVEMEVELARSVAYERYDDDRIISFQGQVPERLYYILAGKVNYVYQYKLSSGQVTKCTGCLVKGMTSDPDELEKGVVRETTLIAKGLVEVLILDKSAFYYLLHTTRGPPLDFLRSLDLFEEFPCEKFASRPRNIEFKYYGANKVINKDSNQTPWLYIIKSGLVKVVRRQPVVDTKSAESKRNTRSAEEAGLEKASSHAEAMMGVQAKQKKLKSNVETHFKLPQIYRYKRPSDLIPVKQNQDNSDADDDDNDENRVETTIQQEETIPIFKESPMRLPQLTIMEDDDDDDDGIPDEQTTRLPSIVNIPRRSHPETDYKDFKFKAHSLWLTREKTEFESIFQKRSAKQELTHRRAYLQLDLLKPGDIFGLDNLYTVANTDRPGVSLLSDGAEVIKINKRFFLRHAHNNTMLKVETMFKEYMSEKEAGDILFKRETWKQYKTALMAKIYSLPQSAR